MHTDRVDRLAGALGAGVDRRRLLRGLAGGTLAGVLGRQGAAAAEKRRAKRRVGARQAPDGGSAVLKVMARNLYLGADLTPTFGARTDRELVAATTRVFATVQATDFPARAKALAEEIVAADPLVVGVQEASLWRSRTPADFGPAPNAEDREYDFLVTLIDELAARGRRYAAVATVTNFDAEAPRLLPTSPNGLQDVRLTDRDAILARTDLSARVFSVANPQAGNFATNFAIANPVFGDFTVLRGWTAVDVTLMGRTIRVVNTHLERYDPGVQEAQGEELIAGPLHTPLPVVLLGDLNSAAGDGAVPGQSDTATYQRMLDAGFVDAWTAKHGAEPGFTCCHAEDLTNARPALTERIDFVLARGDFDVSAARTVGDEPGDRTRSGLWPSDHAGIWAALHLGDGDERARS